MLRTDSMTRRRRLRVRKSLFPLAGVAWFALSLQACAPLMQIAVEDDHAHRCPMENVTAMAGECWCKPAVPCFAKPAPDDAPDDDGLMLFAATAPLNVIAGPPAQPSRFDYAGSVGPPIFLLYQRFLE